MRRAFTLIELLVVIVIIGIIAALTTVALNGVRGKARDTKRIADIRQVQSALEMYRNDNNVYPAAITSGSALVGPNGTTYMNKVPSAPGKVDGSCTSDAYTYSTTDVNSTYSMAYCLGGAVQSAGSGNNSAVPGNCCLAGASGGGGGNTAYIVTSTSVGTLVNDNTSGGTIAWSTPENATSSNNVYASASASSIAGVDTYYLKATDFRFDIPATATVKGILVEIERMNSLSIYSGVKDKFVYIIKADGMIGTTNRSAGASWSPAELYYSYGSSSDVWGEAWDANKINDLDFGVAFSVSLRIPDMSCLHSDSLISTPTGLIKIKDLKIGDIVFSHNDITGEIEQNIVTDVFSRNISSANNRYFYVYVNGKIIKATENHEFYINGSYVRADELKIGDNLLDIDKNEYPIEKIEIVENTADLVWDLTVENNHNFFAEDILVHNISATAYIDHIRITVYYTN